MLVVAVAVPACGSSDGTETDGGGVADERPSVREPRAIEDPALVEVPDVLGESADIAAEELEAEGLLVLFDPEPDDPGLCTVSDQDQLDEIEEGSESL